MKKFLLILFYTTLSAAATAQKYDIVGNVRVRNAAAPIGRAVIELPGQGLWTVTDDDGNFSLKGVPGGKTRFVVSCLGFETTASEHDISERTDSVRLYAQEANLTLESVEVTAGEIPGAMSTSRRIGGAALEHLQIVSVSDITSLLPGGSTVNPNLMNDNIFVLRQGYKDKGNASFGAAVEVDGIRQSTNASFGSMTGASVRNIAASNIESIEVITGIPSAEYGDMGGGLVKISTRKGHTPYMLTLSTNPLTKQIAASKGFDLGRKRGVLNSSVEYARSVGNPISPYNTYSRTSLSLNYQTSLARPVLFNVGLAGNIGGTNSENDPDAQKGEWTKASDNALRANLSLKWLLNRKWITNLDFDVSVNYADDLSRIRTHPTNGVVTGAAHAPEQGYHLGDVLPANYFTTEYIDSKQLDYKASLKATWVRSWGRVHTNTKIGAAWRSEGNIGRGRYYEDPKLAPANYYPRSYAGIPYMHNLAVYAEEMLSLPLGSGLLQLMAGLRVEKTFISGSQYKHTQTVSPRLNLKYRISDQISVRGGWGYTEKLPSFNILYPRPVYQDYSIFESAYPGGQVYAYYTQAQTTPGNPDLHWQRNRNAEAGLDLQFGEMNISLVGFFNRTRFPYKLQSTYEPFSYRTSMLPEGFTMPGNPQFRVDAQSGEVFVRNGDDAGAKWVPMALKAERRTFAKINQQANGSPVDCMGMEFVFDFPQINPIRTQFRLDGAFVHAKYLDTGERWFLPSIMTGSSNYPYVGIYPEIAGEIPAYSTYNGGVSSRLNVNLTATTHLPSIRMIISLRLEASLVNSDQNITRYKGREYAFNIGPEGTEPTGGSVYDGKSNVGIWPIAYLDLEGNRHPFTDKEKNDPAFAGLFGRSPFDNQYIRDGCDPYFSANLSITKEIGNHVSISFYANNFTNAQPARRFYRSGLTGIPTPDFYYGLTVRLKF